MYVKTSLKRFFFHKMLTFVKLCISILITGQRISKKKAYVWECYDSWLTRICLAMSNVEHYYLRTEVPPRFIYSRDRTGGQPTLPLPPVTWPWPDTRVWRTGHPAHRRPSGHRGTVSRGVRKNPLKILFT